MLGGDVAPMFQDELVAKDLGYALSGSDARLPLTAVARDVFTQAINRGLGAENGTSVARLYE